MILLPDPSNSDDKFVTVTVTNLGDRPVTLSNLGMQYYSTKFKQIRQKPDRSMMVNPSFATIPHRLMEGERWLGGINQTADLEKMTETGILILNVYIAGKKRPKKVRVKLYR